MIGEFEKYTFKNDFRSSKMIQSVIAKRKDGDKSVERELYDDDKENQCNNNQQMNQHVNKNDQLMKKNINKRAQVIQNLKGHFSGSSGKKNILTESQLYNEIEGWLCNRELDNYQSIQSSKFDYDNEEYDESKFQSVYTEKKKLYDFQDSSFKKFSEIKHDDSLMKNMEENQKSFLKIMNQVNVFSQNSQKSRNNTSVNSIKSQVNKQLQFIDESSSDYQQDQNTVGILKVAIKNLEILLIKQKAFIFRKLCGIKQKVKGKQLIYSIIKIYQNQLKNGFQHIRQNKYQQQIAQQKKIMIIQKIMNNYQLKMIQSFLRLKLKKKKKFPKSVDFIKSLLESQNFEIKQSNFITKQIDSKQMESIKYNQSMSQTFLQQKCESISILDGFKQLFQNEQQFFEEMKKILPKILEQKSSLICKLDTQNPKYKLYVKNFMYDMLTEFIDQLLKQQLNQQ